MEFKTYNLDGNVWCRVCGKNAHGCDGNTAHETHETQDTPPAPNPTHISDPRPEIDSQLTPRHWFAGLAMQAILSGRELEIIYSKANQYNVTNIEQWVADAAAGMSARYADALISELDKKK